MPLEIEIKVRRRCLLASCSERFNVKFMTILEIGGGQILCLCALKQGGGGLRVSVEGLIAQISSGKLVGCREKVFFSRS